MCKGISVRKLLGAPKTALKSVTICAVITRVPELYFVCICGRIKRFAESCLFRAHLKCQ